MATHYIAKFATTAAFLAASVDNGAAEGVGYVNDVLYANIGGVAVPITGSINSEVVITTNVITANESDKTFYLSLAGGFVSTLPAPALGLKYTFIVKTAPSGGSYTVICAAAGTLIKGHVLTVDVNSATDPDFGIAGELTLTFVDGKAVAGDWAILESDGTNWFLRSACSVFDAITLA